MRTRPTSSGPLRALALLLSVLIAASACEAAPKVVPSGDVPDAANVVRASASVLLQLSAYDYALAGTYAGEKTRIVSYSRYATVARSLLPKLSDTVSTALAASSNAAGPLRDAVVALADSLNEVVKDAGAFADAGDQGTFAKTVGDIATAWDRVTALAAKLPADKDLQQVLQRGTSFTVTARADPVFVLAAGPYATATDADAAAKKIGQVVSVTRSAPFVVRVATYPARAQADAAAAALKTKGIDVTAVSEERAYAFTRGKTVPDAELWREPARVVDTWTGARRVALSPDGKWVATGSDDGTVAIFAFDGGLQALPKFPSGVSQLLFSNDSAWLFAGGAATSTLFVPQGANAGSPMRFPSAVTQALFVPVPAGRAFVAVSKGPTGVAGGGGGMIGARAPDGAVIGPPFPIVTPAAGGFIGADDRGELFIATTTNGGTDVELLRMGLERFTRGVIRVPGIASAFALDTKGDRAALVTDQGTYRFSPHDANPTATLTKVGPPVRDVALGAGGTLYQLEKDKLSALGADGRLLWQTALNDGRRVLVGTRIVVLDAPDRVLAITPDGTVDELGTDGILQDVALSPDGKRAVVVADGRRAVVFDLQ